ncbi:MAG: DUF2163 domain-containing protein [Acidobacteriia bacterium]|nr:DUF2163 domain-containing protein [Terriglobia bacterium]
MKTASTDLTNHLAQEVTTLATLWKITRQDGTVLAFTDHDEDVTYGGCTYLAATGFTRTAMEQNSDLSVANLEVDILLDSAAITDNDLREGKYDYAEVEIRMVNWTDLTQGEIKQAKGLLGQVSCKDVVAKAELRGMSDLLNGHIQQMYSPSCRATLGDSRCKVNIEAMKMAASVTSLTDNRTFATTLAKPENWARDGKIVWTSGNNSGLAMEVKSQDASGNLVLFLPMGFPVQVGDTFYAYPGCDKLIVGAVNVESQKVLVTVSDVSYASPPDNQHFRVTPAPAADWSDNGKFVWVTGTNAGVVEYVVTQDGSGNIVLYNAMPDTINIGDTAYLYPNGLGVVGDCLNKFNNVLNNRSEPFVPGMDAMLQYPNAKT